MILLLSFGLSDTLVRESNEAPQGKLNVYRNNFRNKPKSYMVVARAQMTKIKEINPWR